MCGPCFALFLLQAVSRLRRSEILICLPTALPWANLRARPRRLDGRPRLQQCLCFGSYCWVDIVVWCKNLNVALFCSKKMILKQWHYFGVVVVAEAVFIPPIASPDNTSSTRRFCWRPSAVSLVATGWVLPRPRNTMALSGMPC